MKIIKTINKMIIPILIVIGVLCIGAAITIAIDKDSKKSKPFVFDGEGKTFTNEGNWSGANDNQNCQQNSFEAKLDKENSDKLKSFLYFNKGINL